MSKVVKQKKYCPAKEIDVILTIHREQVYQGTPKMLVWENVKKDCDHYGSRCDEAKKMGQCLLAQ